LRGVALIVVTSFVAGAAFATQDALPESPLHNVKIATEIVRLSLAQSSEHLVAVELDIAEARLREAAALQALDRPIEAAAAVSAYGEHLASAAAHLDDTGAAVESTALDRFRAQVVRQQQDIPGAGGKSTTAASESALGIAAQVAAAVSDGGRVSAEQIAVAAANAADKAATTIEKKTAPQTPPASAPSVAASPRSSAPSRAPSSPAAPATSAPPATTPPTQLAPATPAATTAAPATSVAPPVQNDKAKNDKAKTEAAAKAARDAADRAKQSADRAKANNQE
jgi:hypothetical protein